MIGGIVRHASLFIGSPLIGALLLLAPAALRAQTVWEMPTEYPENAMPGVGLDSEPADTVW